MRKSVRKSVVFEALRLLKEDPNNACLVGEETLDFLVRAKVIEAYDKTENGYYNYRLTEAGLKLLEA